MLSVALRMAVWGKVLRQVISKQLMTSQVRAMVTFTPSLYTIVITIQNHSVFLEELQFPQKIYIDKSPKILLKMDKDGQKIVSVYPMHKLDMSCLGNEWVNYIFLNWWSEDKCTYFWLTQYLTRLLCNSTGLSIFDIIKSLLEFKFLCFKCIKCSNNKKHITLPFLVWFWWFKCLDGGKRASEIEH